VICIKWRGDFSILFRLKSAKWGHGNNRTGGYSLQLAFMVSGLIAKPGKRLDGALLQVEARKNLNKRNKAKTNAKYVDQRI